MQKKLNMTNSIDFINTFFHYNKIEYEKQKLYPFANLSK